MKFIIILLGLPAVGKDTLFKIAKQAWKYERVEFIERVDFDLEIKHGVDNGLENYRIIKEDDIADNPFFNAYDYELMRVDILERYYLTKPSFTNMKCLIFGQHLMGALVRIRYYYKTGVFQPSQYRILKRRIIDFSIRHRIIPTDVVLLKASKRLCMKRMNQSGHPEKSTLRLINLEESIDWLVEILQRDFAADISRIYIKEKTSSQEIFTEMMENLVNLSFGETILTTKFNDSAVELKKAHSDDAGIDLSSVIDLSLSANERAAVPTGWNIIPPNNHYFQVFGRSSLALVGIDVVGGVIDPGYTGEIKVIIVNNSGKLYEIQKGQRIAQAVPISIAKISGFLQNTKSTNAMEIDDSDVTPRGPAGFGSSNKG